MMRVIALLIVLSLPACLDRKQAIVAGAKSASSSTTGFTGAISAANLPSDGLSILINWSAASAPYVSYNVYSVDINGNMTPVRTLIPLAQTSWAQTGLTSGQMYSYIVQAVKADGVTTDGNQNTVSALAYAGVNKTGGSSGVGVNQATVNFTAVGSQGQGVVINCTNPNGVAKATLSVFSTTATGATLTGLYSGTTYTCTVNAIYNNFWGNIVNDSNAITTSFQTISLSYLVTAAPYISPPNNQGAYNGVILVQAYGDAPKAPTASNAPAAIATPVPGITTRQVSITWKHFTGVNPWTAQYRLVRVQQGGVLNMNASNPCTIATTVSCQVCISSSGTNAVSRTCVDGSTSIAQSPMRYEYAVSMIIDPTLNPPLAEELPTTKSDAPFRVLVPIPPQNMALVQRDSVNYEICTYMGLITDPLNRQRCTYNGLGSIPYNTGAFGSTAQISILNGSGVADNSGTAYDFGYNLFVERWESGCNWSPSAASGGTGMCGVGATPQDCFGLVAGPPAGGVGVNGNVFYDPFTTFCYVKQGGTWYASNNTTMAAPSMAIMRTNSPDQVSRRPPLSMYTTQLQAANFCSATIDPNYGQMRMMRRREYAAAVAFQHVAGDPNQMSGAALYGLGYGNNLPVSQGCNNDIGSMSPGYVSFNDNSERAYNFTDFMIGSHYTANCITRYGLQDMIGNEAELFSDNMQCSNVTHTCLGINSLVDSGNRDFTFLEPYNFDGVIGPGGISCGQTGPFYTQQAGVGGYCSSNVSLPMALPFVSTNNDHGMATSLGLVLTNDASLGSMTIYTDNGNITRVMGTHDSSNPGWAGRFDLYINLFTNNVGGAGSTFRCVLPAE